jgi:selenide,water dikinase
MDAAIASMRTLNRAAAEAIAAMPRGAVHACTDITGFGLIGHATEMARASGVTICLDARAVPLFDGVIDLVERNRPGGLESNTSHFQAAVEPGVDSAVAALLYDPQTSGGLLVAVGSAFAQEAAERLGRAGVLASRVGDVTAAVPGVSVAVEP